MKQTEIIYYINISDIFFQSNKSSGILLINDKSNISSPSLNSHSTLMGMGEGTGSTSKHGRNSSISIDHSLTGNHKQRFVRGHSSSGIANESGVGVDREKNPDIIPDGGK